MTISFADYCGKFGKGVTALNAFLTAARTTIPAEVEDYIQEFDGDSEAMQATTSNVSTALSQFKGQAAGAAEATIAASLRSMLLATVAADNPTPRGSLTEAIAELVKQMLSESETFDAPTVSVTPSYGGSNVGDGLAIVSSKDVRGRNLVYMLPETIEGVVTRADAIGTATVQFDGEESIDSPFSVDWPGGSGISQVLTSSIGNTAGNLIGNASFATADATEADLPAGWIAKGMEVGTTILLTPVEVQRLVIASSPTAGYYTITYTAADGTKQTTGLIAWNATETTVQEALRNLKGLSSITVSSSGTSPNFTHDITFTGVSVPGGTITVDTENLTGGTITPSKPTAGTAYAARGARVMQWDPDGAEDQVMHYPVALEPLTQYSFAVCLAANAVPSAGVITVDIVDGIDGTTIQDEAGANNSFTIDVTALDGTPTLYTGVFRTPVTLNSPQCYVRIRATTTIANDGNVYFDQIQLREMTQLYTGGPFVSIVSGGVDWAVGDTITLAVANNRAGDMLDWHNRIFRLREQDIYVPNASTGTLEDSTYVV